MQKVAEDHPHHALWIIMALANAHKDDELLTKESANKRRSKLTTHEAEISDVVSLRKKFIICKIIIRKNFLVTIFF